MSVLGNRLVAIHAALEAQAIPHGFGGAIALAYCTFEPRGTQDLDINIFVSAADASPALAALPAQITITPENRRQIATDGQTRAWWENTPIDLFFNTVAFHEQAAARARNVEFMNTTIPVLDCFALAVLKVFSNPTKDWADLEAMRDADQLDIPTVRAAVVGLLGEPDERLTKLDELAAQ